MRKQQKQTFCSENEMGGAEKEGEGRCCCVGSDRENCGHFCIAFSGIVNSSRFSSALNLYAVKKSGWWAIYAVMWWRSTQVVLLKARHRLEVTKTLLSSNIFWLIYYPAALCSKLRTNNSKKTQNIIWRCNGQGRRILNGTAGHSMQAVFILMRLKRSQ